MTTPYKLRWALFLPWLVFSVFSIDIVLSLAGQKPFAIIFFPFLSFELFLLFGACFAAYLLYLLIFLLKNKSVFGVILFLSVVLAETLGCSAFYESMSRESDREAETIVSFFLENPAGFSATYDKRLDKSLISFLKKEETEIQNIYTFRPYGRYVFLIKTKGGKKLYLDIDKGFRENKIRVLCNFNGVVLCQ